MFYTTDKNEHGLPHNPFKSLVMPRPIGWISSISASGVVNLAPYSFFNAVADSPPLVMFTGADRPGKGLKKDTLANVEETGDFVFNLVTWELREPMSDSSESHPPEVDELEVVGLTPEPSKLVKSPRVAEAKAHLECKYLQTIALPTRAPSTNNFMVLGEVVGVHISEDIMTDGKVDTNKFRPVARLGYWQYAVIDNVYTMVPPG